MDQKTEIWFDSLLYCLADNLFKKIKETKPRAGTLTGKKQAEANHAPDNGKETRAITMSPNNCPRHKLFSVSQKFCIVSKKMNHVENVSTFG